MLPVFKCISSAVEKKKIWKAETNKNGPTKHSINIGILAPFSQYQRYSVELFAAIELAIEDINSHGGILGKKLVLIRGDTAGYADLNISIAKEMIEKYNVKVILPEGSSSYAMRVAKEVTIAAKIPFFCLLQMQTC